MEASHPTGTTQGFFEDRRAGWAVVLVAVTVLALASLPFLWGWRLTPPGFVFSGAAFNLEDIHSYLAKMRQGFEGAWSYTNRYTTEPHRPALLFMFYVALGHVARWIHLPLMVVYHLARSGFGLALLLALDRLLRVLGFTGRSRVLAFVFAAFATGLGIVMKLSGIDTNPSEIWWGESYVFHTILLYPHFAAVSLMIVLSLTDLYLYGMGRGGWTLLMRMALWAAVLAWGHPRLMLNIMAVGGLTALAGWWQGFWRPWRWGIGLAVLLVCWFIPSYLIIQSYKGDPVWEQWAATDTPAPPMLRYFATYGLLWILAGCGLVRLLATSRAPWVTFVAVWAVVGAALPYLPITGARRLVQGLDIPLGMLAAHFVACSLMPWIERIHGPRPAGLCAAFVTGLLCVSTLWFLYDGIKPLFYVRYPWYYGTARVEALDWLREHTDREDVVLSSFESGLLIPAIAGNRVYVGHWAESLDQQEKSRRVKELLNGRMSVDEVNRFAAANRVKYLFMSSAEARVGPHNPAAADPDGWSLAYDSGGVRIYRYARW